MNSKQVYTVNALIIKIKTQEVYTVTTITKYTRRLKQLKIGEKTATLPIIQGGMGVGISRSSLAGAVAKEGGVGVISTAQIGYDEEGFEKLRRTRKRICKSRSRCHYQRSGTANGTAGNGTGRKRNKNRPDRIIHARSQTDPEDVGTSLQPDS